MNPQEILASIGIMDVSDIEPVNAGMATSVWQVLWGDGHYALRVFRPEQVAVAKREVAAMRAAVGNDIEVPDIIKEGVWKDNPVLLISWLPGEPLLEALQNQPQLIDKLGEEWGVTQAAIHRIPAPDAFDANEWISWAGDEPELKARLKEINPVHPRLLHLDYHPMNVMVDDGQISGVIDWANARAGDPRADFARTCAILRFATLDPDTDLKAPREFFDQLEAAWTRGYEGAGGNLDDMALFHAWAGAAIIRDLTLHARNPDTAMQEDDLEPLRNWRDHWKQKAGITA